MKRYLLAWTLIFLNLIVWSLVLSCASALAPMPKEAATIAAVSFEIHDFLMQEVTERVSVLVKEKRVRPLSSDENARLSRLVSLGLALDRYREVHNAYLTALRYYQAAQTASEAVRRDSLKIAQDERRKVKDAQSGIIRDALALNLPLPGVITSP